ncbi:hypothetical protein [Alicyclobacillus sp. ALC3]|uniref:hypothetical protein n=1 Tax=Alicyclobacillus sp. ALC3 TaxID=2796143 RepID=UPI0023786821|nr:hypothetical protein [Alicyclobacillus sp. ALC3]WDL98878.1 hypothetical protein JC200_09595 [Alicyclobacillus sp. ALC3]
MKHKAGLIGVVAAGIVAVGLTPIVAFADSSSGSHTTPAVGTPAPETHYASTTIKMTGGATLTPQHVVANDPWSEKPTSWLPMYYLQKELKSVGVQTTWDGNTLDVTSVPSGWSEYTLNEPVKGTAPAGQMQFSMGGNQLEYVRAPKLVTKDPASGEQTTYVPVYYANLFLANRLSMFAKWSGSTWNLSPQDVTGVASGSKTATTQDYQTLNTVKYSTSETSKIDALSKQQGVKVYIPSKMGGPSGWYVPGTPNGSNHVVVVPFEDMSFYEASSWTNLIGYFSSANEKPAIDKGGSYTLIGGAHGQWYTFKYTDGARFDLFALQEGNTWIGIEPNPAKYTISELVQAVAETLQPV